MRNVHHWTKEAASKVLLKYNIRKTTDKNAKKKDYHSRRKCPVADCHSIVRRLPKHLQTVHNLSKESREYKYGMLNAPVAPDRKHAVILWQEQKLKTKTWDGKQSSQHSEEHDNEGSEDEVVDNSEGRCIDRDISPELFSGSESDEEDDEEDDYDYDDVPGDIADKKAQSRVTLPPIIVEFQEWLASPDGSK
jgi:hypothetical protein